MTRYEQVILELFAERYPTSAHAAGGRKLRLSCSSAFPFLDRRKPDEYESFLEAAEKLERQGIFMLQWKGKKKGEDLASLTLQDVPALFSRLNKPDPAELCTRFRAKAEKIAQHCDTISRPFFAWLAASVTARDMDPVNGEPTEKTAEEVQLLVSALYQISTGLRRTTLTRALSVELFSDSKRIEQLVRIFQPLLRRAERAGIALPPFDLVDRSYPETLVAGSLDFICKDTSKLRNPSGMPIGLPFESVMAIKHIEPCTHTSIKALLGIENKESFHVLAERLDSGMDRFSAIVYVGGHPNRAVQALFRLFGESGWTLFHAGDLDPDGILILQELSDAAQTPVLPWMMNTEVFEQYRAQARPLDADMHQRALRIREDTRNCCGLGRLLESILASGLGIEQEIIQY